MAAPENNPDFWAAREIHLLLNIMTEVINRFMDMSKCHNADLHLELFEGTIEGGWVYTVEYLSP